jgi:hypothetical protein
MEGGYSGRGLAESVVLAGGGFWGRKRWGAGWWFALTPDRCASYYRPALGRLRVARARLVLRVAAKLASSPCSRLPRSPPPLPLE